MPGLPRLVVLLLGVVPLQAVHLRPPDHLGQEERQLGEVDGLLLGDGHGLPGGRQGAGGGDGLQGGPRLPEAEPEVRQ